LFKKIKVEDLRGSSSSVTKRNKCSIEELSVGREKEVCWGGGGGVVEGQGGGGLAYIIRARAVVCNMGWGRNNIILSTDIVLWVLRDNPSS